MPGEPGTIHRYYKDGLQQKDRNGILDYTTRFRVEERTLARLLTYMADMAGYIAYYDPTNKRDGSWQGFFEKDHSVALARIISFNNDALNESFESAYDMLQYYNFIGNDTSKGLNEVFEVIFYQLKLIDHWLGNFKSTTRNIDGFRDELLNLKSDTERHAVRLGIYIDKFDDITNVDLDDLALLSIPKQIDESQEWDAESMLIDLRDIQSRVSNNIAFLKDRASYYFSRSLDSGDHDPQIGLIISFLKLYLRTAESFDNIPERFRDFYYRDILNLSESTPQRDKAILTFQISDDVQNVAVPAGTVFPAGSDEQGNDIEFELINSISLNNARVTQLITMFVGRNNTYGWNIAEEEQSVTGIYFADKTEHNFSGSRWALLGEDQTGLLQQNRTMDDGYTGFAISGSNLYLTEGRRRISLRLYVSHESYEIARQQLVEFSSTDENENPRTLMAKILSDGLILDYTSDDGWIRKKWFTINIRAGDAEQSIKPFVEINISLNPDEKPICFYDKNIHGGLFRNNNPVVRLRLNPDAHLFPYSLINKLEVISVGARINVADIENLTIHNNSGLVNANEPFFPFGPVPEKGSGMIIGHPEAFHKAPDFINLKLHWENLPDHTRGMYDHYRQYGNDIDNSSFKISLKILADGTWKALEDKERFLFDTAKKDAEGLPEAAAKLLPKVAFTNVSMLESRVRPQPEILGKMPLYTTKSRNGFVKVELSNPVDSFGHKQYPMLLSNTFLMNSKIKKTDKLIAMPNEPYTPLLRNVRLDYQCTSIHPIQQNTEAGGLDFYHLHPLTGESHENSNPEITKVRLLPKFEYEGQLIINIKNVTPPQVISLFFHLRDHSSDNTFLQPPDVIWEYRYNNEWVSLDMNNIIRDTTKGFINSGIVVLELPELLRHDKNWRSQNTVTLRVCAMQNSEVVCRVNGVQTQAAIVHRKTIETNHPMHPVPTGSISNIKGNITGLDSVSQPMASFGGQAGQDNSQFYITTSEALRHRNIAVNAMDYETLILNQFKDIRKVNCLPGVSTQNPWGDPGTVMICVIPDAERYEDTSRYRPRFSSGRLDGIRNFLSGKVTPFASIEVRNPRYERITVRCKVSFKKETGGSMKLKKLNEEICKYISPWMYDPEADITFADTINLADITGFIHSRTYINFVTGLSVIKISEQSKDFFGLQDTARISDKNAVVEPSRPWSVMVSDVRHQIEIIEQGSETKPDYAGVGNLELGDDFIIS